MDIRVYFCDEQFQRDVLSRLDAIGVRLDTLDANGTSGKSEILSVLNKLGALMQNTLDTLVAQAAAESTQLASLQTLIAGVETTLAGYLSGETISAGTQAKIDNLFSAMKANSDQIAGAINTIGGGTVPTTGGDTTTTGTTDTPPVTDAPAQ
jgi:hypothetical protein